MGEENESGAREDIRVSVSAGQSDVKETGLVTQCYTV